MSQFVEQAEAVQVSLDALRAELHDTLAEAGSHLRAFVAKSADGEAGPGMADLAEREGDLEGQVAAVESERDRIRELEGAIAGAKKRAAELGVEVRELSENLEPIYEEIGRIAFEVYRGNPLVDEEYAGIFSPLVEVNSELAGIDASIDEQQELLEEKPFLEKMVIRGRIALLRNRRATREGTLRRLLKTAGSEIMGTGFVDEIADPRLSEAAEPYRERLKATREREDEIAALQKTQEQMAAEIEQLCGSRRTSKRLQELEEDLFTLSSTRDALRVEMAQAVRSRPKSELPAKSRPLFKKADELEERLAKVQSIADRIDAAIAVERLEMEKHQLQGELTRKEKRLNDLKKEIADLKKQKTEIGDRIKEKTEARGPVSELLAPELLDRL